MFKKRYIYDMGFPRRSIIEKMERIIMNFDTHFAVCILFNNETTINHWKEELITYIFEIYTMSLKSNNNPADKDMWLNYFFFYNLEALNDYNHFLISACTKEGKIAKFNKNVIVGFKNKYEKFVNGIIDLLTVKNQENNIINYIYNFDFKITNRYDYLQIKYKENEIEYLKKLGVNLDEDNRYFKENNLYIAIDNDYWQLRLSDIDPKTAYKIIMEKNNEK